MASCLPNSEAIKTQKLIADILVVKRNRRANVKNILCRILFKFFVTLVFLDPVIPVSQRYVPKHSLNVENRPQYMYLGTLKTTFYVLFARIKCTEIMWLDTYF
jgi:hypothetical protein